MAEAYLRTYHILSTDPLSKDFSDLRSTGNGFVIEYRDRRYLVTCEHVIMPQNEVDLCEYERSPMIGVISGRNDDDAHQSVMFFMGGWYQFTASRNTSDELNWPVPVDLAFCDACDLHMKCVSAGFYDEVTGLFVPPNTPTGYFPEALFMPYAAQGEQDYFVIGKIIPTKHDGWNLKPKERLHENLKFVRTEGVEIVLHTGEEIRKVEDWAGLGGCPVVSADGRLLGMLVRVVDDGHEVFVMPIWRILKFIDMVNGAKQVGIDTDNPFITVPPGTTMNDVERNAALKSAIDIVKNR